MSKILSLEQIALSKSLIENAKSIVITSHKSPDGDAVGSSLGLYHILKALNKEVSIVLPDTAPDFLTWMEGYTSIIFFDKSKEEAKESIAASDLIFCLDYNIFSRTGNEMQLELEKATAPMILIDHHQQPGDFPKVTYSDTSACSTCEMVYRFADQCGWKNHIDLKAAECIYCGIMTDSGSFRFPSVSPETHYIVAHLMEMGLDHARVHRSVYDTNLLERMRLTGYALSEKLEANEKEGWAIISLTLEELERYHHRPGDTEGLVNQALSIKNIKVAAFLRQGNNEIKVSFRSKGTFDVNVFARASWNGGGHKNAAGGNTSEDMSTALERLKTQFREIKNEIINS